MAHAEMQILGQHKFAYYVKMSDRFAQLLDFVLVWMLWTHVAFEPSPSFSSRVPPYVSAYVPYGVLVMAIEHDVHGKCILV